ncbi:MAG: YdcF family protein [Christensenellaceae bacterium]|jgi:uncharacterized SAM-binding protein YcdF (DUF218 family)|nr:YdcF family protein [Christensenellaceae bacterium]
MRIFFFIIGCLLTGDTLILSMFSNGNLGTYAPAMMGAPLVVLALFYPHFLTWFATPFGRGIKWAIISIYAAFIVTISVMACVLWQAARKPAPANCNALIVLGCGVRGERPSLTLRYRLDAALSYLNQSPDTIAIVSGGQGSGESISEAEAMRRYLVRHGIQENRILLEDKSTSTYENFLFSKEILTAHLGESPTVAFVTTGFHVYRAGRVAAMQGIPAQGIAAKDMWYTAANNYIREGIAVIVYTLNGKLV